MALHLSRSRMLAGSAASLAFAVPNLVRSQTLQKVRLMGVQTDDLTPVYYAMQKGLYREAGLDIEMIPANSGTAATAAVVSGSYELGKGSVMASLLAHLRNLPLVLIANGVTWDANAPVTEAIVAADSPIKTAADLNGKIAAATALNDIVTLGVSVWMDKNGGDSKSLKWVELPNSAEEAALESHRVDLVCPNQPQLKAALDSGKVRLIGPYMNAIAQHFVIAVYFANTEWASKNPELARSFARVTYQSAAYTNSHQSETAAMMSEVTKIPIEIIRSYARPPGATSSDPALLQPVIDMAAKYKNIPRSFTAKDAYIGTS